MMKTYFKILASVSILVSLSTASCAQKSGGCLPFLMEITDATRQMYFGGAAGSGKHEEIIIKLNVGMKKTDKGFPKIEKIIVHIPDTASNGEALKEFHLLDADGKTTFKEFQKGTNTLTIKSGRYYPGKVDEMPIKNAETEAERKQAQEEYDKRFKPMIETLSKSMQGELLIYYSYEGKLYYKSLPKIKALPSVALP